MLVFALYKREAARLEQFLQRNNYDAVAVHGDKGQVCLVCICFCTFAYVLSWKKVSISRKMSAERKSVIHLRGGSWRRSC